jgi:hypothetical protein
MRYDMRKKLTEDEKKEIVKLLDNPMIKKKLTHPEIKKTNLEAQLALKQIPNAKTDGILSVLDWIEDYLLILKNK